MVERLNILTEIDQQLSSWEELLGQLREALEATAFSNRFVLPPRRLPQIAEAEADAFLDFLKTGDADKIREQGAKRAEEGLGEQAMLLLGTTLRQFCRDYLADEALRAADVYADALLEGFMEGREAIVLREQEQIRKALQRVVNRYALQLATAAEVSRAASSILDPAKLLPEVVNLIRDRFNFYYVGLFLLDESEEYAVLRAGTGEAGRQMLEMGHKLEVGGTSMVGWCVANAKARIALDVGKEAVRFDNPLLPKTRSEMALPLISRGRVIGAMTIQSAQSAAFSEEDTAVLQTMADQLANAIENARLYDGAQREITERRRAEEALAEERNLLRTIIDNLPDYIYAKDTESRFVVGNIGVARLMGATTPDELLGKTDFGFYPQELATQYYADEQEIIRSGQPLINREEPLMDQVTGKRGWLSTTKVPLRDSLGKIVGIVGIGRDITERKRTEADLESRALQLQTSAEVSRAASSILDPDKLIQQVVDLVRERFDLYYAGLFLLDEERQFAVLRAGTGEAGRQMLETGHKLEVGGESMIGQCVARGEARIALDVGEEAVRFDNPLLPETRSEMALPLVSRGQIIGAMTIQSTRSAAFSEEDIAVLQTMADQLANAIENARLFEEALARTQEVAALVETGRKLVSTLELDAVLDSIMEACLELFQVQQAAFIMMDEDGYLRMRRHRGLSEEFVRSIVDRPGEGFYGKVYQSGEAILVRDAREQRDPATAEVVLREGITSFIHVPVKVKGETVAVMNLTSSQEDRRFSERDLERLSAFTDQAAVAIENARLFKEAQERAEDLAALNTIASAVSRSLELQDLLQETLSEVISVMGFEAGLVSLADEMPGQLVLSAQSGLPGPLVSRFEEAGLRGTLCDFVFQTSEGLGINDLRDGAPVNVSGLLSHGIRSYLGAPLMYTGQSLGTICIFSYSPQPLTAADFSLIAAIGQQLGVAVRNARLFEETQHRAVQLRIVNEVGRILTSILDVDTLLGQVVRLIRDTFDYYQVNLGLIEGDALVPKASTGALSTLPAEIARLNLDAEAIVTKVVTSGTPLLVPDVRREPLYQPLPGLGEIRSELAVPLKSKDQVIGVLDVESDRLDAFDEGDLTVLEALAGQIAVAIENARLFQETQARTRREQILREITARVRGSTDPDAIMRTAVRELGTALGRPTFVRLGSAEQLSPTPMAQAEGGDSKGTAQQGQRELVKGGE